MLKEKLLISVRITLVHPLANTTGNYLQRHKSLLPMGPAPWGLQKEPGYPANSRRISVAHSSTLSTLEKQNQTKTHQPKQKKGRFFYSKLWGVCYCHYTDKTWTEARQL